MVRQAPGKVLWGICWLNGWVTFISVPVLSIEQLAGKRNSKGIEHTTIEFRKDVGTHRILLDGYDVTDILTTNEAGKLASAIAVIPEVRTGVLPLQRQAGKHGGVILDGRDIGTVVFPDANVKFYLDASPEERAKRRHLQLQEQGIASSLEQLILDIKKRDHNDSTREASPLRQAEDAFYIDSTPYSLEEVVDIMEDKIRKITDSH
jgi:cytidylate kinase